jgi:hypothetical protein
MYGVAFSAACLITAVVMNLLWGKVREIGSWLRLHFIGKRGSDIDDWSRAQVTTREVSSTYFSVCLVTSYLIYPSFTAGTMHCRYDFCVVLICFSVIVLAVWSTTFNCREIDGVLYLAKDLGIRCDSPQQKTAELVAGFMLVVYSAGLPLLYLAILVSTRPPANAAGGREHSVDAKGFWTTMVFFHRDYSPDCYYWEVVELLRKLILTAVTVQFPKVRLLLYYSLPEQIYLRNRAR